MIPEPLWSVMCSAHGCDPACGCDADFEISVGAMRRWIADHDLDAAGVALDQLHALIALGPTVSPLLERQCRRRFETPDRAVGWLMEWREALTTAVSEPR